MVELGLVPFTPSKQHEVACLEDVYFDPKRKAIVWKTEKNLKMGTQPGITIVTKKTVMKNVEEYHKQMASMGVVTATANSIILASSLKPLINIRVKWQE